MSIAKKIIEWLLEPENPSLRYRTLTELLGKSENDALVRQARERIPTSTAVMRIISKMHPDGYWLQKNPRTGEVVGDDLQYGSYATTHFCLAYLTELGLEKAHPQVYKAADRYLGLQMEDGDFYGHFSCLYGFNIRTYIKLGFRDDPRLQKSIDLMLLTDRLDGGYLCDMHEGKYKTRSVKSCIRGSVKTLLAYSELPEYWQHPRCRKLIAYFLDHRGIYQTGKPDTPINHDVSRTTFPITWRAGLGEILLALSKMGFGGDDKLKKAWELLESKRTPEGKYLLDWFPSQALLKPGKKGEPNKWITFYALLALKNK